MLRVGVVLMVFALALTAVAAAITIASRAESEKAVAAESSSEPAVEPLVRSKPTVDPWVEKARELAPVPEPEPEPEPRPEPEPEDLPVAREDWPMPTDEELAAADEPRSFDLPRGAIMALTIDALGIRNAPVFSSTGRSALENGVAHLPGTSFPWSGGAQRNVYLAAHRLGYEGTGSRLIFYRLNKLAEGDEVMLKDRDGRTYRYRVTETFVVNPGEDWVTGQVRGRDMVTLQTCTPIPTFDKRLIVRADRI
jgi:sortase A